MANSSSPSHIYTSYSGNINGTFNNTSCPSAEIDYTVYFKLASVLLFVIATTLISGFATLASIIRSLPQARKGHCCSSCHSYIPGVEAHPSADSFDEHNVRENTPEDGLTELKWSATAHVSGCDAGREIPYPSSPQHPSSPQSREKKGRKLWKKVQTAVSNGGWATHAMNAATVAAGCVLGGPPSLQYNLPTPATEPGRPY